MKNKNNEKQETVIKVENLSKNFKIPHEKTDTLRGSFVNLLKKKTYESFKALDKVSFEVKKGEFFGIIGRNGSGKSTLLKILAGIYEPDQGKIEINGGVSPFLELGVGFNMELSGRDNIYLNGSVLGLKKKEIDEKYDAIVEFSELKRFIDQKLKNYSSGMQVRLAFSVAIYANKDILLMDEVLAVGDSNFQAKCIDEFNKYRDLGKTVILVAHDVAMVQRYCDRAMLLRKGKIEKIGSPRKVVESYIYQNMNDEERRIFEEEKEIKNSNSEDGNEDSKDETKGFKGNKVAKITKVEFLDNKGKKKNVFKTGEDICARVYYQAKKEIRKPVFGVAIFTQDGINLAGPNTKTSEFKIDKINGKGFINFHIIRNQFFTGTYEFTAALFNWDCNIPLDLKEKKYVFKIVSTETNQYGIFKLKHIWEI